MADIQDAMVAMRNKLRTDLTSPIFARDIIIVPEYQILEHKTVPHIQIIDRGGIPEIFDECSVITSQIEIFITNSIKRTRTMEESIINATAGVEVIKLDIFDVLNDADIGASEFYLLDGLETGTSIVPTLKAPFAVRNSVSYELKQPRP